MAARTTGLDTVDRRKQFSVRLRQAVERKCLTYWEAANLIANRTDVKSSTVVSHIRGDRTPRDGHIRRYAELYGRVLDVEPDFLLSETVPSHFNQLTQEATEPSSQPLRFRSIGEIPQTPGKTTMSDYLHIPTDLEASEGARSWTVPSGDRSMTDSPPYAFDPGTRLIADPKAPILSGHAVLCKPKAFDVWLVRIFKAPVPFDKAKSYSLVAANPLGYPEIVIANKRDCEIFGRVTYSIHNW